jgi:hypothetical protein
MSKTTAPNIPELLKEVQTRLDAKCKKRDFSLQVLQDGYTVDDDWINIVVSPSKPDIRAYDYVEILSEVEKELRAAGHENVLLVPTLAD